MVAERPFVTWTFDKHCESMDWSPSTDISLTAGFADDETSSSSFDQADLVIVGVFAPAKEEDNNNGNDDDEEEKDVPPIVFSGKAKELDDALGGALTELAAENSKAFQNGGSAGKMTPATRIRGVEGGRAATRRFILLGLGHEEKKREEKKKEEEDDEGVETTVEKKEEDAAIVSAATLVAKAASAVASSQYGRPVAIQEEVHDRAGSRDESDGYFANGVPHRHPP